MTHTPELFTTASGITSVVCSTCRDSYGFHILYTTAHGGGE